MDGIEERLKTLPETWSINRLRFWEKVDSLGKSDDECWNWTGVIDKKTQYGSVKLNGEVYKVHRIAYYLHCNIDPGHSRVLHTCNNTKCCNPHHLFEGTHSENMKQRHTDGRYDNTSENNPHARFTNEQVISIRDLYKQGWSVAMIAREYNCDWTTIKNIVTYKCYKEV